MKVDNLEKMLVLISKADNDELDILVTAIKARHRVLHHEKTAQAMRLLEVGDRVRLMNLKPRYLNGIQGTIIARTGTKFSVEMDQSAPSRAQYRYGGIVRCPAGCLELIEAHDV